MEISDGTIALDPDYKRGLIERLSAEFVVLAEVGSTCTAQAQGNARDRDHSRPQVPVAPGLTAARRFAELCSDVCAYASS